MQLKKAVRAAIWSTKLVVKNVLTPFIMRGPVKKRFNPRYGHGEKITAGNICIVIGDSFRLGDFVMVNYAVRQLQSRYNVTYCIMDWHMESNKDFLQNHCLADDLVIFPKGFRKRIKFVREVRRKKLEAVALFPFMPRRVERYLYWAGVPVICSIAGGSRFVNRIVVEDKFPNHHMYTATRIVDVLCGEVISFGREAYFPFTVTEIPKLDRSSNISICVHTGGQTYWNRRWPESKYLKIFRLFLSNFSDATIYLVGGREEWEGSNKKIAILEEESGFKGRVVNFCGVDLNTTANVMNASDLFLGNDSAPMHIATALKKRVISIFGPSPIKSVTPVLFNDQNIAIISDMECAPCFSDTCKLPKDQQYSCLNDLPVELIWKKMLGSFSELGIKEKSNLLVQD